MLALNRDGTGFVQMFGDQIRRSLRGSTSLLDPLSTDADSVLLIAEDNAGLGVWRADVSTGRAERVARGPDETRDYVTDGAGYPVIRIDGLSDFSGFRIFRRANGAEDFDWGVPPATQTVTVAGATSTNTYALSGFGSSTLGATAEIDMSASDSSQALSSTSALERRIKKLFNFGSTDKLRTNPAW